MRELNPENLLECLADFACNLKFEDLPPAVSREAKRRLVDSLGCLIMGTRHDGAVKLVREGMRGKDRQPQLYNAFVLGMDGSYTLEDAAFLNTHAIRALDWNDAYLSLEPAHPSDNIGALLALAGRENCSGKNFLTALVLAYDIQCRFCDAASLWKRGWDHTYYLQLSSALAAGKIMELSKDQMKHAASMALLYAPLRQGRSGSTLSNTKGLYAAYAARKGAESARLALSGATGPSEIIEGEFGLLKQITGGLDLSAFDGLGRTFKISKTHIKFYPVEYHAQAVVDLGLKLKKIIGNVDRIARLEIYSYEFAKNVIGDKFKRRPETKESADHSIFFVLASALLDGEMTLKQYEPARLRDARIWRLIDLMSDVNEVSEYNIMYHKKDLPEFPVSVAMQTKDGWMAREEISLPRGHFLNPLNDEELKNKFGEPIGELDFVRNLEKMNAYDFYWALQRVKP